MDIAGKLDEGGKPAWIAAMIAGFIIFWPAGLAILAYLIWSGRMGCRNYAFSHEMRNEWQSARDEWRTRKREMRQKFRAERHRFGRDFNSSGNSAFDDYKAETLRRLEEEQAEFNEFLDNLRKARDKAEFDQFMQSRKNTVDQEPDTGNNDSSYGGGSVPNV